MLYDMSNTKELRELYESIGNFIFCVLMKESDDPLLTPSQEIITSMRNMTMEFMKECLDITVENIRSSK